MNIGDLFLQLLADGSKLTASVTKEAEKAGDAGAKTLGQKLSTGLKTGGIKAFGVAASGAFAIAAKGALELENATAQFRAETGATAEEAAAMGKAINSIAGDNLASLEAVTDAAIRVRRHLGATGAEAVKLTDDFVRFARVTRQDAAGAVEAFDDILDSWGLTVERAASLMDQLKVSQDKYGGSIEASQTTLAALAPAMRAANLEIDDGIALLNLFGAKGLDANTASAAFAKALTKVKSPQELQDLIVDISNTEDPFLRAEKAAKLFGARAGAKLANALAGANLDDYKVSIEEAAGATQEAADILDSTFSGRVQKAISQATAALREFGASFGPALSGLSSLAILSATVFPGIGTKIAGGIGKGILSSKKGIAWAISTAVEGVTANPRFGAASTKIGTFMGSKLGKGLSIGLAAFSIVEVVQKWFEIQGELDSQTAAIGQTIAEQISTDTLEGLESKRGVLQEGIQKLADMTWWNPFADFQRDDLVKQLDQVNAQIEAAAKAGGATAMNSLATGLHENTSAVTNALDGAIVDPAKEAADKAAAAALAAGKEIPEGYAEGIISNRNAVRDGFSSLMSFIEDFRRRGPQIAGIIGELTSKKFIEALHDNRPEIRRAAEAWEQDALTELEGLIAKGEGLGKKGMRAVAQGLKSENPAVRARFREILDMADGVLGNLPEQTRKKGEKGGKAFGQGIKSQKGETKDGAKVLTDAADTQFDKAPAAAADSGRRTGSAFARAMAAVVHAGIVDVQAAIRAGMTGGPSGFSEAGKRDGGHASGGREYRGRPRLVGERGPEVFVPNSGGYTVSRTDAIDALGGGGGDTFNIPVHVTGVLRAQTPDDVARPLRELARTGVIQSRRRRRMMEVPTRG